MRASTSRYGRTLGWAGVLPLLAALPAAAASDARIASLTLCRDSWLDWQKNDPSALDAFGNYLGTEFSRIENDGSLRPKHEMTIDDLKITKVFPTSVGMGLGFSVILDATFEDAKQAIERDLGKPLTACQAGEGMRACELSIAEQRTVMLISGETSDDRETLAGCYYFYEK